MNDSEVNHPSDVAGVIAPTLVERCWEGQNDLQSTRRRARRDPEIEDFSASEKTDCHESFTISEVTSVISTLKSVGAPGRYS